MRVALVAQLASAGFMDPRQVADRALRSLVKSASGRRLSPGSTGALCESECAQDVFRIGVSGTPGEWEELEQCSDLLSRELYGAPEDGGRRLPSTCMFDVCTLPAHAFWSPFVAQGQPLVEECRLLDGLAEADAVERYRGLVREHQAAAGVADTADTSDAPRCLWLLLSYSCFMGGGCTPACVGEDGFGRDETAMDLFCGEITAAECSATCPEEWLGDGTCDPECGSADCGFDAGDCDATPAGCSAACPVYWLGDGMCDPECESADCGFDGGDCDPTVCSAACPEEWLGDGMCDSLCNQAGCDFDGGDCAAPAAPASSNSTAASSGSGRRLAVPEHFWDLLCVKHPEKDAYCGDLWAELFATAEFEGLDHPGGAFPDTCAIDCAAGAAAAVLELGCCTASGLLLEDMFVADQVADQVADHVADHLALRSLLATCGEPADFTTCAARVQARLVFAELPAGAPCEDVPVAGAMAAVQAQAEALGAGPVDLWACEHTCGARRLRGGADDGVLRVSMLAVAGAGADLDAEAAAAADVLKQVHLGDLTAAPEAPADKPAEEPAARAEAPAAQAEEPADALSDALSDVWSGLRRLWRDHAELVLLGLAAAVAVGAGCYACGRRAEAKPAPCVQVEVGAAQAPPSLAPVSPQRGPPPIAFQAYAAGPYPTPPNF